MSVTESRIDSTTFYDDVQRYDLITRALSGVGLVEFHLHRAWRGHALLRA
jgi:hypothetical protein